MLFLDEILPQRSTNTAEWDLEKQSRRYTHRARQCNPIELLFRKIPNGIDNRTNRLV